MISKIVFIFIFVLAAVSAKVRYDNYTLFKILPVNAKDVEILQNLQNDEVNFDFWTDPVPSAEFVNILTNPNSKWNLEKLLHDNDIKFEITLPNIQEAIDKQAVKSYSRSSARTMDWNNYYDLDGIYSWLENLPNSYDAATLLIGGSSHEGREIKGVKISHGAGRKAIVIEAGIHAREWISPATACYIINELLTSDNEEIKAVANDFDWYIFPVTNPDGYVYSINEDRMWRKNRRQFDSNYGVDLNRNWNSNWLVAGASSDSASNTYAGPGPFSEEESRTLAQFLLTIEDIEMYLSFHSFGQLLLLPYGNSTQPYGNYHDMMNIGRRAMGALSVRYGTQYTTGNVAEAIYLATGSSTDWVKDWLNVPIVYCYEFRDKGQYGFLLPADQIIPNALETMDSILDLIHQAKRYGYLNNGNSLHGHFILFVLTILSVLYI